MERSWTDSYFDSLEFFYWEPQHLGRKKHADSRLDSIIKVREHLRVMEVTLNHNFSQFLSLAPREFRRQLFQRIFSSPFEDDYVMHGRGVEEVYGLPQSTQPDLFFTSPNQVVSLEMKLSAKSSIEQVIKYALLGLADEIASGQEKHHYLVFLSPGAFSSLWKEGWNDVGQLTSMLHKADIASFLEKQPNKFRARLNRLRRIVETLTLGHLTYKDVTEFLHGIESSTTSNGGGAEVYRKLINGLVGELKLRNLA